MAALRYTKVLSFITISHCPLWMNSSLRHTNCELRWVTPKNTRPDLEFGHIPKDEAEPALLVVLLYVQFDELIFEQITTSGFIVIFVKSPELHLEQRWGWWVGQWSNDALKPRGVPDHLHELISRGGKIIVRFGVNPDAGGRKTIPENFNLVRIADTLQSNVRLLGFFCFVPTHGRPDINIARM